MQNAPSLAIHKQSRFFIPSLALALFGTSMLDVLASLFLVDLAKTFVGSTSLSSIAIISQIAALSSIAAVTFGILSGFLSVRIDHKKLLLIGAGCIFIGATGCYFAPSLLFMQIFYPFDGIGTIVVAAMAATLIGEILPIEQRPKAIGYITGAAIFSSALGFAFAGFFADVGGWRSYLSWYVIPISLVALILAFFGIPFRNLQQNGNKPRTFVQSFKDVLLCKSATACLFGHMLLSAGAVWSFFAATFWRQTFSLQTSTVALITVLVVLVYALGGFVG